MRTAFIDELVIQARQNKNIFLVVGDLGFSVVEPFADEFPERFINAGVAEQNMTGLAAGLASEGYHVFTYSIGNFPTLRCLEQIRNDVCYHKLPVTIVAVGAGLSYGNLGYSHHAVQDIGILRTLPHLSILSPADPGETRAAVEWLSLNPQPSYLRLGKAGEKVLYNTGKFHQNPIVVRSGRKDIAIVATGAVLDLAIKAAENETELGRLPPTVFSMPWVHPLEKDLLEIFYEFKHIICVEEHVSEGGLREMLAGKLPRSIYLSGLSIPVDCSVLVGSQSFLRESAGLTAVRIQEIINQDGLLA